MQILIKKLDTLKVLSYKLVIKGIGMNYIAGTILVALDPENYKHSNLST